MPKNCAHGTCQSVSNTDTGRLLTFVPFPKPKSNMVLALGGLNYVAVRTSLYPTSQRAATFVSSVSQLDRSSTLEEILHWNHLMHGLVIHLKKRKCQNIWLL